MATLARIIRVDGSTEERTFETQPSLEFLQNAVGGHIAFVKSTVGFVIMREKARELELPNNATASVEVGIMLVGDVVVLTPG